jgi:putative transposase
MYEWRKMNSNEKVEVLKKRYKRGGSYHRPPLIEHNFGRYMITAACYEHKPIIGRSPDRMAEFEGELLVRIRRHTDQIFAHVILPNHYHILVEVSAIKPLQQDLGKFHGATSYQWNAEDQSRGRKVFHGAPETFIKSERHFWSTMNYIHNNPVRHGYVSQWEDWPYTSAHQFLEEYGRGRAQHIWKSYPIDRYGDGWDDF